MKIQKTVSRELTEREIESIKKFRSYSDGVSFACLCERVMVMLCTESSREAEKMKSSALELMNEVLSSPPDFVTYNMNDGRRLLLMQPGVFAYSEEPCTDKDDMSLNFILREECLEACEKMEVIAVVYEEDYDGYKTDLCSE